MNARDQSLAAEKRLRVLIIEDNACDFELMMMEMTRSGLNVEGRQVDSAEGLQQALAQGPWDIVLSDHRLPGFNSSKALRAVRAHDAHLPFIVVSGKIGEEDAIAAIRAGAQDYVLKDNMQRLVPALIRETRQSRARFERTAAVTGQGATEGAEQGGESQLLKLAANMSECFWLFDRATRKLAYVNPAYETIYGRRIEDLVQSPRDWMKAVHPEDAKRVHAVLERMTVVELIDIDQEFRVLHGDGTVRWVHVRCFPVFDRAGNAIGIGGVTTDISNFVAQQDALRKSELEQRRLADVQKSILDSLSANIAILDESGCISAVNQQWRLFGGENGHLEEDYRVGANYLAHCERRAAGDEHAAALAEAIRVVLAGEKTTVTQTYPFHSAERERWFQVNVTPLHTTVSRGAVVMHTDITDRVSSEKQLAQLAHFDSLTGLPNRLLLRDRLGAAVAAAARNDWNMAVMFVDLDRFKAINDTLGHDAGDIVLKEAARRLRTCVRASDTVGRLGGDEFALVLQDVGNGESAATVARKIIDVLAQAFILEGNEYFVSASVGITLYPSDSRDPDSLVRHADTAMYRAKELGRNNFQYFTAEMNAQAMRKMELEIDLRRALNREEFVLEYQPKVSCISGNITGVEALLRWKHPLRGVISPAEFVPLLEETGLIVPVGEWVLRTACRQTRAWHEAGLGTPTIAVNLSGRQFHSENLSDIVKNVLDETGLDPVFLELELTESFLMRDPEAAIATLARLKATGIRISVDDFGTGHSSLSYLKRFPLDALKVDRSFVADITADPSDASITRAVIMMAHNLKLQVIAEGVETEGQVGLLIANGCDAIQGHYFSASRDPDTVANMLRQGKRLASNLLAVEECIRTLLLVEAREGSLAGLKGMLHGLGYRTLVAHSAAEALEQLAGNAVDVVVANHGLAGMPGLEFFRRVRQLHPQSMRLLIAGNTDVLAVSAAGSDGTVHKLLSEPLDGATLASAVDEAFRRKDMADENRRLGRELQVSHDELARVNKELTGLLEEKSLQAQRDEAALGIAQEVLQHLPWPFIGIDAEGMIAAANAGAERILAGGRPLLGNFVDESLPADMLRWYAANDSTVPEFEIEGQQYTLSRHAMGLNSRSQGTLLVMKPARGGL